MTLLLMLSMSAISIFLGWLSAQHIGWLDPYSNGACVVAALVFIVATVLVTSARLRFAGALTGCMAALLAFLPFAFNTVVLLAFSKTLKTAAAVLPLVLITISLAVIAILAFKVARANRH